ncbi:hypothetical protein ACFLU4_06800 [Chloroflexota bacterium]
MAMVVALTFAGVTPLAAQPSEVWVDDDWAGSSNGDAVDGHTFGTDAFTTIQGGIDAKDTCENSLAIDITDFVRFATAYETVCGDGDWNELTDFNCSGQVEITDFSLLYMNYGRSSPQVIE